MNHTLKFDDGIRGRDLRPAKQSYTFMKDKKVSKLNLLFANEQHGASEEGRIIMQKSSSKYKMFNKRNYLIETVEWLPRFNEALKDVRKYEYYDVNNNVVDLT